MLAVLYLMLAVLMFMRFSFRAGYVIFLSICFLCWPFFRDAGGVLFTLKFLFADGSVSHAGRFRCLVLCW